MHPTWKVIFVILPSLLLMSASAVAADCTPTEDSCDFYGCLEAKVHHGSHGYPMKLGHRYCERFRTSQRYTPEGAVWVTDVRLCLMESLRALPADISRRDLRHIAIKSHRPCYVDQGYCQLGRKDRWATVREVGLGGLRPIFLRAGLTLLFVCQDKD